MFAKIGSGEWFGALFALNRAQGLASDAQLWKNLKRFICRWKKHYSHLQVKKLWISNAGFCSMFICFCFASKTIKIIYGFIVENDPSNGIHHG